MSSGWLLLWLLCAFGAVATATAGCTKTTYEAGGTWLKCFNGSLAEVANEQPLAAITMLNSDVKNLSVSAFHKHRPTLISIALQNCGIEDIPVGTFAHLPKLKKLTLSHNNIKKLTKNALNNLPMLEQLDLSYNKIERIDTGFFSTIPTLRLLNLDGNRLTCFSQIELTSLGSLNKIRVLENPLTFLCRGRLTLWLKDHGVNYSNEHSNGMENWLDSLLWLCATGDAEVAKSEEKHKQCVLLAMFNQLKDAIVSLDEPDVKDICVHERIALFNSVQNSFNRTANNSIAIENIVRAAGMALL